MTSSWACRGIPVGAFLVTLLASAGYGQSVHRYVGTLAFGPSFQSKFLNSSGAAVRATLGRRVSTPITIRLDAAFTCFGHEDLIFASLGPSNQSGPAVASSRVGAATLGVEWRRARGPNQAELILEGGAGGSYLFEHPAEPRTLHPNLTGGLGVVVPLKEGPARVIEAQYSRVLGLESGSQWTLPVTRGLRF